MSLPSLIRKARKIKDNVSFEGGLKRKYYKVKFENSEVGVVIQTADNETFLTKCTCKHHSVKDPICHSLCCYFLAVLFYLQVEIK